ALNAHLAGDGIGLEALAWVMEAEHTFSHIHWNMDVYAARLDASPVFGEAGPLLPSHYRWIGREDMAEHAFPNVFIRILNAYFSGECASS
ncbi:NUDIX domain-containing protein, partial [Paenibacillus validus]|nr:NUDIX domain-containing protein [Paenibacillus validus]